MLLLSTPITTCKSQTLSLTCSFQSTTHMEVYLPVELHQRAANLPSMHSMHSAIHACRRL